MKRRTFASVVCVMLVAAAMLLPRGVLAQHKAGPAKTLRIGYVLQLSGWYSVFDANEDRFLKAAAQMINERGGITIQGQQYNIELVGEDGKSTLDGTQAAASKLTFDDKVRFVVGPSAFYTPAVAPTFEANKIMHVSSYVTHQPNELDASTPYGFLGYNSGLGHVMGAVLAMKKEYPKVKKLVIATPDDGAVPYFMPLVKKFAEGQGYTIVGSVVAFPNESEDYNPIAVKLNQVKDADAVLIVAGAPVHFGSITKGLRTLGNKKPVVCATAASAADIAAISGKAAANDVISMATTPHAKGNPAILDELFDKGGKKMPALCFTSNALWVLTRVIQAANSLDPTVVKAKWETMDKVEGVYGISSFGGDKTFGLKHHAVSHPQPYQKLVNGNVVYGGWVDVGRIP